MLIFKLKIVIIYFLRIKILNLNLKNVKILSFCRKEVSKLLKKCYFVTVLYKKLFSYFYFIFYRKGIV